MSLLGPTLFHIWAEAAQTLKISLLGPILAFLGPGCQNAQNGPPGTDSGHIWAQAAKTLKMSLLRLILTISDARQQKCSK